LRLETKDLSLVFAYFFVLAALVVISTLVVLHVRFLDWGILGGVVIAILLVVVAMVAFVFVVRVVSIPVF